MKKPLILIIFLIGCYNEKLISPKTNIIKGPENCSIINTNIVKIVWKGDGTVYYQYSIDGKLSDWTISESVSFILDDGWHNFWVRGKNILGEKEENYPEIIFCIDGLKNGFSISPIFDSLRLYQDINILLKGENLKTHSFEYVKLAWDKEINLIEYRIDSSVFSGNSLPIVLVKEYQCSLEIYRTNMNGFPEQDFIIGNFKFSSNETGKYEFKIKEGKIFDSLGFEIPVDTLNGGTIVIY